MFDKGTRWIESCVGDGWSKLSVYPFSSSETVKLERDGFVIHVYDQHSLGGGSVAAWGPDKLCLELPDEYDWEAIQAAVSLCSECDYIGVTVRLGFAQRVCPKCRARLIDKYEYPGWCS